MDGVDERLQTNRGLDGPSQPCRRARGDGDPEVLVKHSSEFDAGLEQERLPTRQRNPVNPDSRSRHGRPRAEPAPSPQ
jgi:hypothetical protein